jgi:aminopeptidase-like protein
MNAVTHGGEPAAGTAANTMSEGAAMHRFATELYPICRSITGNGLRQTLGLVGRHIPLKLHEIPTGTSVFDWEVPLEWNIEDAWVLDPHGRRVVDFREHNLHIVNYSEPARGVMDLDELKTRLHSLPDHPTWIPYRTSYFRRTWGFCLRHRDLESLTPGKYEFGIVGSLAPGSLTYGECVLPGRTREEVVLFTHVCHPSLANDNTSGIAVATRLAAWLAGEPRRYTYRVVFAPGTLGTLCWLKHNESRLARFSHGLELCLLGDSAALTYKVSRRGDCDIDRAASYVLRSVEPGGKVIPFEPYGYHERQLCSPGFNLPVGRLTRSVNDGYPEYHTSADDLDLVRPEALERSLDACKQIVDVLEYDRRYLNLAPKGEPRLGKRGLYGATGGRSPADRERAMLWVLNQSDGTHSLLEIAERSGSDFGSIRQAASELEAARLLRPVAGGVAAPRRRRPRQNKPSKRGSR